MLSLDGQDFTADEGVNQGEKKDVVEAVDVMSISKRSEERRVGKECPV